MSPPLVSLKQAAELVSLSRTMVNRLRLEGRFPAAVELGEKRIAFVRAEVDEWIAQRVQARDAKARTAGQAVQP